MPSDIVILVKVVRPLSDTRKKNKTQECLDFKRQSLYYKKLIVFSPVLLNSAPFQI